MSKRQRTKSSNNTQRGKRSKPAPFAAPSADDHHLASSSGSNPSSSASSERYIKPPTPPTLVSLCITVFAQSFRYLSDEERWEETRGQLKQLPDSIAQRIFSSIKATYPRLLNHAVITAYFLRGSSVILNEELGVTAETLSAIARVLPNTLQTLELSGFSKFSDNAYASTVKRLPLLEVLILRNCSKVGPTTIEAVASSCPRLKAINLNFTSATATSLVHLLLNCPSLEVLKMAGVRNLSDATVNKMFATLFPESQDSENVILKRLRSLKLRHNTLSDVGIHPFLQHCPALKRLDLSFTSIRHLPEIPVIPPLEKLSLTSTFVPSTDLAKWIHDLPNLKTLNVGAMGINPGSSTALMNATGMTLNDDALWRLTDALLNCHQIQTVNLVQNAKIGLTRRHDSALSYFVRRIGRKCTSLNLSGIPSLRSEDLAGLLPEAEDEQSSLKILLLNKTGINDDAATLIASCPALESLEVAETRITASALFRIIHSCDKLSRLNLTGCRGVNVVDRRKFFEVWDEQRDTEKL